MTTTKNSFKKIAIAAARAGDSKKAHPVTVFDLAGRSPLAEYAVLLVVESAPQLDAVEEEVQVKLKHEGIYCLHRDGTNSKNWKVLDYGGVLVHIYDGKAAEFYAIDKVYSACSTVEWEEAPRPGAGTEPAAPAAKKAPAKKPAARKASAKKPAAKKAAVKKPAAKKAALKKVKPVKKAPAKKSKPAGKAAAKKSGPAKKAGNKRPSAGHSPLKRRPRKQ